MTTTLPQSEYAVQLTGPDTLELNTSKAVPEPGPYQILCKVEATGLCFSDLKLLKQFDGHVRKSAVIEGVANDVLEGLPSYAPGKQPVVPGHETVVTVVKAGENTKHKVGDRFGVQADWRWVRTKDSNGAFGYNFEGALQEYVLLDERIIFSPGGDSMLLPAPDDKGTSAVCLVEPWACVEHSYVASERGTLKAGGRLLVVVDAGRAVKGLKPLVEASAPGEISVLAAPDADVSELGEGWKQSHVLEKCEPESYDDIVYFGSNPETLERVDRLLAKGGLANLVTAGGKFGRKVSIGVGRVHYGGTRFIGTTGDDASQSMQTIPARPELRADDLVLVIGAGGPMGVMHVIRDLCAGIKIKELIATDFDNPRLEELDRKAGPVAAENGVAYRSLNPSETPEDISADYSALMVPVPALVASEIENMQPGGLLNIFAGIPATVWHEIDMDAYVEKGLYMIGTSGSGIEDMRIVLNKVTEGTLDTNLSVGAISGMAGAIEGIRAVENRTIAGKILVYPMLHELGLLTLEQLQDKLPSVYAKLNNGQWTKEAEAELLKVHGA